MSAGWPRLRAGHLSDADLRELDAPVEDALARRRRGARCRCSATARSRSCSAGRPSDPRFACKRLPVFPSRPALRRLPPRARRLPRALGEAGVDVVETELRARRRSTAGRSPATSSSRSSPAGGPAPRGPRRRRPGRRAIRSSPRSSTPPRSGRPAARARRPARQLDLGRTAAHLHRRLDADDLGARDGRSRSTSS